MNISKTRSSLQVCISLIVSTFFFVNLLSAQETGEATYYSDKFHGTGKTASGEIYDKYKFTAAHKTLAFGTWVRVTNLANNRSVDVRINDRGPYTKGRVIDLSKAAAEQIDLVRAGVARVRIEVIDRNSAAVQDLQGEPSLPASGSLPPVNGGGFKQVDVSGLPLLDQNGNPVNAPSPGQTEGRPTPTPATDKTLEEAAKYTPALFRMSAVKEEAAGYGVQVGAYFTVYRLLEAMNEIHNKGYQNTLVHSSLKDNKPVFRIIIGPYEDKTQADALRKKLGTSKITGVVVNLGELK